MHARNMHVIDSYNACSGSFQSTSSRSIMHSLIVTVSDRGHTINRCMSHTLLICGDINLCCIRFINIISIYYEFNYFKREKKQNRDCFHAIDQYIPSLCIQPVHDAYCTYYLFMLYATYVINL